MTDFPSRPYASQLAKEAARNGVYSVFLVDAEGRKLAMFYTSRAKADATVKLVDFVAYACNHSEPPPS